MVDHPKSGGFWRVLGGGIARFIGASLAVAATVGLFLVMPLINEIAEGSTTVYDLGEMDQIEEEREEEPPEEIEEEEEQEDEEPPPEPEMEQQELEPISIDQLEMALGGSGGVGLGDGAFSLDSLRQSVAGQLDGLSGLGDMGGRPEPLQQPTTKLTASEAKHTPGRATVFFMVTEQGRVEDVRIENQSHPSLGQAAVRTVKKWRFRPAKVDGKPVAKPVRQTIDFPKQ